MHGARQGKRISVPGGAALGLRHVLGLGLAVLLTSCGFRDAQLIELDTSAGRIDLGAQLQGHWDRVCILMPYSTSNQAERLLGFSYSPELHSAIAVMDDRTLLVTAVGNAAEGSFEVMRRVVDFTTLGPGCYKRTEAVFVLSDGKLAATGSNPRSSGGAIPPAR